MSPHFDRIKRFHDRGLWSKEMVADAVRSGVLTEEEYEEITAPDTTMAYSRLSNVSIENEYRKYS